MTLDNIEDAELTALNQEAFEQKIWDEIIRNNRKRKNNLPTRKMCIRDRIRSIHIILFVMLFLVGSFINISTIHAEAGSRTGSIQIIYKGRNSSDKEVTLSGAKFSIFPIQYMKNDELIWEDGFKDSGISLQDTSARCV